MRMDPVSGAMRARNGNGCGQIVGDESQCCPMETQLKPMLAEAAMT